MQFSRFIALLLCLIGLSLNVHAQVDSLGSSSVSVSANSDNDQDASRQNQPVCGERCKDLQEANAFINELQESETPGTYEQVLALIEEVQEKAEYAQSQVRRFSKHGWGGLNRSRKRKKKKWQKVFKQLGEALIDLMNQADALATTTGSGEDPDFEAQVAALETQVTQAAISIQALDDAGIVAEAFSAEDRAGLLAAGSSGSGGSGSDLFGQDFSAAEFQDIKGIVEEAAAEAGVASASGVGQSRSSGSFSSGSGGGSSDTSRGVATSGADGPGGAVKSNTLTAKEANTYKTHLNGDAIGISAASIFGIVNQKYRKSDKSKKFFLREY